jgi:hypothetical protein
MTAVLPFLAVLASAVSADGAAVVALDGDSGTVAAVEHALAFRAVRVVPLAGTDMVQVHVQPDPLGIRLSIHDRNGHLVERLVANAEIAAAVVDSWVRDDLARPLLEPHEIATIEAVPTARPPAPAASSGASVTVAGETALATDGSLWMGAGLGACVRVGQFCIGLGIHAAGDTAATGKIGAVYNATSSESAPACTDETQRKLTRFGADASLTADLPLRVGAVALGPGIGLGAGWLSTNAALGGHAGTASTIGPRAEARLLLSVPLGWGLAVELIFRADVAPLAHRKDLSAGGFTLPGEPLGLLRLGLGLRYGPLVKGP